MKKALQLLVLASTALTGLAFANEATQTTTVDKVMAAKGSTTAEAQVKREVTTVVSPRTGIRYTLGDTGNRPIVLQTAAIAPANSANINRIVASNPALSAKSQEKAKIALIGEAAVQAADAAAAQTASAQTQQAAQ
ncbi:hypothetical protein HWI77_03105 [Acinetobacter venetianus]|jgi:hypothetical protein|uniref:Uncharacterized protein n=1 Tax=Acinetobacter venetianus (strain ATCC 31012 / DSM 23050 / BCRC 14357 / CCUG 45561 / CIP 110063 / KCTC 2702 / LMG 19082 / RAG-1) TaxID=1191460 RepID=N8YNP6_ACIVR|nr:MULTISPECIES: hypothetical protein [Acinetobacter]MDA0695377.1 hypothetical protein [Pseudomonadota bacterium]ENV38447.1 hypothetical protein F959_00503 [Acinetobacter venetianus RAG-1 = CIP 110063]ERP96137.1 signal peptide protein [Acinetobacter sp. COS3]KXO82973.1 hypothetical protein AYL20_03040 [Acinetobacter venetianus]MBC67516.1 hypothetical protein [Acinetobacter sp.]